MSSVKGLLRRVQVTPTPLLMIIAQCVRSVMIERVIVIASCVQNTILYLEQMMLQCIEDYGRNEFSIPLEME
jgi:hypothetical protein